MTHGHELRGGERWREWGYQEEGNKGEKKEWDNCNSIINKIYFKKGTSFNFSILILIRLVSVDITYQKHFWVLSNF